MSSFENSESETEAVVSVQKKKKRAIADSDSDEGSFKQISANNETENKSDESEDDSENILTKKQSPNNSFRKIKRPVLNSDSEEENKSIIQENDNEDNTNYDDKGSEEVSKPVYKPFSNSDLYDAEDSDDENVNKSVTCNEVNHEVYDAEDEIDAPVKSVKNKDEKKKKEKKKKEKVKSSSDNMREIRRESQRMVRESSCILPYHVPKQRTLAEFIQRRKSVPSIPLKTNTEQLLHLGKQIEEMEKQSEEFFKSDVSEDSDEEYKPNKKHNNNKSDKNKPKTDNTEELISDNNKNNTNNIENSSESNSMDINSDGNNSGKNHTNNDNVLELLKEVKEKLDEKINELNHSSDINSSFKNTVDVVTSEKEINNSDDLVNKIERQESEESSFELKMLEDTEEIVESKVTESTIIISEKCTKAENSVVINEHESTEISFRETIINPERKEINSSVIFHYKNSEDFSLRLDDSEQILLDDQDKPYVKSKLNENCPNERDDEKMEVSNDEVLKSSNSTSNAQPHWLKSALNYFNGKENSVENDTVKNKFQGLNIDLNKIPQLKGNSNEKINLYSPPKSTAITNLKERFFKHFSMENKVKVKKNIEISVVTAETNQDGAVSDIKKETIEAPVKLEERWLEEIKEAQPGQKLARLKAHLEKQLKERWKEDWNKRIQEYKLNEEEKADEDGKSDYEADALLEDENEEDLTETESEEEVEENDVPLIDKKRPQSEFLDDEADESEVEEKDDDDNEVNENSEENEEEFEENEDILLGNNGSDTEDEKDESDSETDNEAEKSHKKKKLTKRKKEKRRLKCIDDDDDDDDSEESDDNDNIDNTDEFALMTPNLRLPVENKDIPTDNEMNTQASTRSQIFESSQTQNKTGTFIGIEDLVDNDQLIDKLSQADILKICSGTFHSQAVGLSQLEGSDEKLNSQFYNQSQDESQNRNDEGKNNVNTLTRNKSNVLDDSDDDDIFEKSQKSKKHKIQYSDDEDETKNVDDKKEEEEEEEDDDDDDVDEEIEDEGTNVKDNIDDEEQEIEYDSEENEVIKDGKGFLENEAELSDSEWDSDDEDEKDLDKFEAEAGDEDVLDQEKVNRELGKIHAQQMLVDDTKEVRLLQEMLLEDGELHTDGSGRVRQFRWANADGDVSEGRTGLKDSDDDDDSDHGDEDENWRRIRHEREVYLQKQSEKLKELGIEDIIDDKKEDEEKEAGDLLEIGRAALKKMNQQQTVSKPLLNNIKVNVGLGPNALYNTSNAKRGSFLKSSEHYLSRLAHITSKVGSEGNVNGPKNSRNFVFCVVSPPKQEEVKENETKKVKKRKGEENVEATKKKLRFSDENKNNTHKSLLEMLAASN